MDRHELEDLVWKLPRIQDSGIDFDTLEGMTDAELLAILNPDKPAPKTEPPTKAPRIRYPARARIDFDYIERDGRLMRRETWRHYGAGGTWDESVISPCGARVTWRGRMVSASLVLHWVRTGEIVSRAPRAAAKTFRAVVRVGAVVKHLGYFATREERDAAVFAYRIGANT